MSDSHTNPPAARWPHWAEVLLHHFIVALLVASVVTLLHAHGALGWLDAVMLNAAGQAQGQGSAAAEPNGDMPVVLIIGAELYERDFAQTSPLNRRKLAQLIRSIVQDEGQAPDLLVVDLDLSPIPGGEDKKLAQGELDDALEKLVAAGTRLLLPLPARAVTPELQALKFSWLERVCRWNIPGQPARVALGLTEVKEHLGRVLQYDKRQATLGVVAADFARADFLCRRVLEDPAKWRAPFVSTLFNSRIFDTGDSGGGLKPFNARFFRSLDDHLLVADSINRLPIATGGGRPSLVGRTIFLGGGYDEKDRFLTPLDPAGSKVEGVVIHAATGFSARHPVTVGDGLFAFGLDIVLGLLIGYFFHWTWGWFRRVQDGAEHAGWPGYLAVRGSLLLNLTLPVVLIVFFMILASDYLYPRNYWVNPGPIILGVFAKFLITSRGGGDHSHHGADGDHRPTPGRWLDIGVATAVVVAAIWAAAHH